MSKFIRLTYEEKIKLANEIKDLSAKKIGEVVDIIKENCSEAFKETDDVNCQIVVDHLNKRTIEMINSQIIEPNNLKKVKGK